MNPFFYLRQVICDYIDCRMSLNMMSSPEIMREFAEKAVRLSGSNVVKYIDFSFKPHGYTLMMVLENSSLSLHTWPEEKFISVEIFTCGEQCNPRKGLESLTDVFKPETVQFHEIKR